MHERLVAHIAYPMHLFVGGAVGKRILRAVDEGVFADFVNAVEFPVAAKKIAAPRLRIGTALDVQLMKDGALAAAHRYVAVAQPAPHGKAEGLPPRFRGIAAGVVHALCEIFPPVGLNEFEIVEIENRSRFRRNIQTQKPDEFCAEIEQ